MRSRVQRQAAKAGGWRVQETSMRAAICAVRGGGERVQTERGIRLRTADDGGAVGRRKEMNDLGKL